MRSDVKVFLICLAVVAIFLVAYFVITHHTKNNSSRRITAENVLPSQQPALTPTTPVPDNNASTPAANSGGTANIPDNTNMPSGTVPPATPGPTTQTGLGANVPPTVMPGQVQPGGELTMNSPHSSATQSGTDNNGDLGQANTGTLNPGTSGTGTTGLNQAKTSGNANGSAGGLAGLHGTADISGGHHARTYVIRHGDTLTAISQRIYGSARMVRAIERANPGVDPRHLRVGRKIKLPRGHGYAGLASRHVRVHSHRHGSGRFSRGRRIYVVRRGDTLIKIARREYHRAADWKLIYRANRRQIGSRPGDLRIGEKLVIPAR